MPMAVSVRPPVLVISPLFLPARGGLPDHTQRLAEALSGECAISVLTSVGSDKSSDFQVLPHIRNWGDAGGLRREVEEVHPRGEIIWEYVPHMYGRGGVNLRLPSVMRALHEQRRPQLVIAHEVAAPFSIWPHRFLYALAHRSQWRRIVREVDAVGVSTERWLKYWTPAAAPPEEKFFLAPSSSNIQVVSVSADHAREWRQSIGLPVSARVLAFFGTLGASKLFDWVMTSWLEAFSQERPVALVVIGDRPKVHVPAFLSAFFKPLGFLPAGAVSEALQAIDVLTLPFFDGVSERRGSFMAGLDHGCAIVTTIGFSTGPTLRKARFFDSVTVTERGGFAEKAKQLLLADHQRRDLGHAARQAYQGQYQWPRLTEKLLVQLNRIRRHYSRLDNLGTP